jgi:hypothetical protein
MPSSRQNPYGDGRAAARIVASMIDRLPGGDEPSISCDRTEKN